MAEQISQLRAKVARTLEAKVTARGALVRADQEWAQAVRALARAEQAEALALAECNRVLIRSVV
jgi:multidrug efflux pump subunit AcrA (membrane-fusion protein)